MNFQARSLKFSLVVDLDKSYRKMMTEMMIMTVMIMMVIMMYMMIRPGQRVRKRGG